MARVRRNTRDGSPASQEGDRTANRAEVLEQQSRGTEGACWSFQCPYEGKAVSDASIPAKVEQHKSSGEPHADFGAVALILAVSGAPAHAGLSTNCLATGGSNASLLLQIKKNKKHSGQSQNDSGLTNCTIVQPGGGGGCKGGFKYVCEKMKSGDKCCGCVPAKGTEASAPPKGETPGTNTSPGLG